MTVFVVCDNDVAGVGGCDASLTIEFARQIALPVRLTGTEIGCFNLHNLLGSEYHFSWNNCTHQYFLSLRMYWMPNECPSCMSSGLPRCDSINSNLPSFHLVPGVVPMPMKLDHDAMPSKRSQRWSKYFNAKIINAKEIIRN